MCGWAERPLGAALAVVLVAAMPAAMAAEPRYGLGTPATPEQIAGWDIDVRPDGHGLPPGQGTAEEGEVLYAQRCAACHGEFGEGRGRFPALLGGRGSLAGDSPVKTVGSFWPHATTVFDYLRRAQPFGHAQSLSDHGTYALTAFLLNLNELVEYDAVIDAEALVALRMPNRDGFVADERPDVPAGEPCMRACRGEVRVVGRAGQLNVTPQRGPGAGALAPSSGDPARGRQLFVRCTACHSVRPGEHRSGPSLHAVIGRRAGTASGYPGYSPALRAAGVVWDEATLARFIASPEVVVPGTAMAATGVASRDDVRDLVAYLRQASGP
jgi:cytochrome c